jgi:hypothetical protein
MKKLFLVILLAVAIIVINACRKTDVQTTNEPTQPMLPGLPNIDSLQPGSYKLDTTITYQASNPHPDTSGIWLANILAEWGSYQSFKIPALAGVDTSRIKVFRRIGAPVNYPWRELSYDTDLYVGMAVPLYGGVYTISGDTISVGIGIIGSPVVTIYLRITVK